MFVPELKVAGEQIQFSQTSISNILSGSKSHINRDIEFNSIQCLKGRYNLEGDFFGVDLGRSEGPET